MVRKLVFILLVFTSENLLAQNTYWQQYLHYFISAQLNDKEKSITGEETIVYKNNSAQLLTYIWFHIYPNAYSNESTALFEQIRNDPQRKVNITKFTPGYISNLSFTVDGNIAKTEPHPNMQYTDIIKVLLPKPLPPGDSITIATPFKVQLPSFFSRSGYADGEFMACQWYPKPAVFDKDGWHEMPYLEMGEFYSEYASYNVNITLPGDYVVGATGVLQTPAELAAYKAAGSYNTTIRDGNKPQFYKALSPDTNKTLSYYADSVPDFAWFADKEFVIEYDTIQLSASKVVDAFTYYHRHKNTAWTNSIDYVKDAVHHYSQWIGEYDYPIVQAVEGPKNNASGGMEYPTITLITSPDAGKEMLDGVITHEVGHNWFMSMLGTNERDHAWMDEGLNTYYQFRYEAEKYRSNYMLATRIPEKAKKLNEEDFQLGVYKALDEILIHPAIETTSENFKSNQEYSLTEYIKTAEWVYLLEIAIGMEKTDLAFQNYFNVWKFKHPQPSDMKAAFEQALKVDLSDFFALLKKENKFSK